VDVTRTRTPTHIQSLTQFPHTPTRTLVLLTTFSNSGAVAVQIAGRIHEQGARETTSPGAEIMSCDIRDIAGRFSTTVAIRREAF